MLSLKVAIVLLVVVFHLGSGEKLPDFIKLCKKSTVNISKCIEDNANLALPHLLKGVKELNIPPLTNLKIPKIYSPSYVPYDFNFEGNITKLDGVSFNNEVYHNFVSRAKLIFPTLELVGKYKLHDFVGKMPINGKGPANVNLHNVTLEIVWTAATIPHLGIDYYKLVSVSLISYNVSSISYKFGNLFDGDKIQGEIANQLLNEHWWILAGNFLPHVPVYLVELAFTVVDSVARNVTINDIFPPV